MEHIAILRKGSGFIEKIESCEKTIESRWYKSRKAPYKGIDKGDTIYFKESSRPVSLKADVEKVIFYDDLNTEKIREIIKKYGRYICIDESYMENIIDKRYCTLVFIENIEKTAPFDIDKSGFGNMCAWISISDIDSIRI